MDALKKIDGHPVHIVSNHHHSTKMDVLQKIFCPVILAAKWIVRHSSMSPNQQRRPLPSLLSLSFFYARQPHNLWFALPNQIFLNLPIPGRRSSGGSGWPRGWEPGLSPQKPRYLWPLVIIICYKVKVYWSLSFYIGWLTTKCYPSKMF